MWVFVPFLLSTADVLAYTYSRQWPLLQGCTLAVAHSLSLGQTLTVLPTFKGHSFLWLFAGLSAVAVLANNWKLSSERDYALKSYANLSNHPIESLSIQAEATFGGVIGTQSRTYREAKKRYMAKYKLEAPPGFEHWFDFAVARNSPIIDEFDTLYRSLAPFRKLNGTQIVESLKLAYQIPGSELWLCEFRGATGETSCRHRWRKNDRHISLLFNTLLGSIKGEIPDVGFLVNHLDEPRVLLPPTPESIQPRMRDLSHQNTWTTLTEHCHGQVAENYVEPDDRGTSTLPFIESRNSSMDLCQHPEYKSLHGIFQSPTSFKPITGAVPILSTGTLSTMGDILIPSPAHIEEEFQYDEEKDIEWHRKLNNVYWAGSTTGGYAKTTSWSSFHRQRFVALAQNLVKKQQINLRHKEGVLKPIKSAFFNTLFFDVAFTRIFQCSRQYCKLQHDYFRTKPWSDSHQALQARFAFDLDGNGISGRYYQLLSSNSAVMKQTLFREWHDDRLVPWVHYIPVSMGMKELPELVSYLVWSERGQKQAQRIAKQGREWMGRALRREDMAVYLYRVLLELARLQDLDRVAIDQPM